MIKIILLTVSFLLSIQDVYSFKSKVFKENKIMLFSPVFLNPDAYSFEFGFLTMKRSGNYSYNAYAKAFIGGELNLEVKNLRAAALGAKVGVILPTQPWFPISLDVGMGFARTALQKNPWFGKNEENLGNKDMFLAELAVIYLHRKRLIYRVSYQTNNVDYFTRKIFLSIGGNY